ncbi:MAG: DUF1015 domain-containing protein [Oscillospiraceae bacterium]
MREDIRKAFQKVGASVPNLLMPQKKYDLQKFAVIACDQFSAKPEYWGEVERFAEGAPSALNMIIPEAWLKKETLAAERVCDAMEGYLANGVFRETGEELIFVKRETSAGIRKGLIIALDLENYDFSKNSKSMIRATEATVVDRLPARVEIRRGAPLEMPHIIVLLDDRRDTLMSFIDENSFSLSLEYNFTLMQGGGGIQGFGINDNDMLLRIANIMGKLLDASPDGMLYAMGDGNHSFAAAKQYWDEIKPGLALEERENHPARFALCELVNLYDSAMAFEPIHRALLGVDVKKVQSEVGFDAKNPPELQELQPLLDEWLANNPQAELEYIHGSEECEALCAAPDRLAIIMPPFDKGGLFDTVRRDGAYVRKSFSIGCARDKRYYLECRKIKA